MDWLEVILTILELPLGSGKKRQPVRLRELKCPHCGDLVWSPLPYKTISCTVCGNSMQTTGRKKMEGEDHR